MDITARGYVSNGKTGKTGTGKTKHTYTVGVKQKFKAFGDQPERVEWLNLNVTDTTSDTCPPDKSYVTLEGRMTVRKFKRTDQTDGVAHDVFATRLEVAAPLGQDSQPAAAPSAAPAKDPWE